MTPTVGYAAGSAFVIPCRRFFFASIAMDPGLASGTYYAFVFDAATAPANTTVISSTVDSTHPRALIILPIVHVLNSSESYTLSGAAPGYPSEVGYEVKTTGSVTVYLSSTAPAAGVTAAAGMWLVTAGTS